MYKVFLVEDEIVVRESMRDNFPWEDNGFIYAGEASDGEMALPLIEEIQPHIVITDIRMPFVDGLSLSRILRKNMPWLKIIILTGHNEFDYARQAVGIGVNEFVLKPIGSDELLEVLGKTAAELQAEEDARDKLSRLEDLQKRQNEHMVSEFLNDLTIGALEPASAALNASRLGVDIIAPYYAVLLVAADVGSSSESRYTELIKLEDIVGQLSESNSDLICFRRNLKEHVIIVKGSGAPDVEELSYRIGTSLKAEVEDKTECRVNISIGGVKERVSGISESFGEAGKTRSFGFIFGDSKIISVADTAIAGLSFSDRMPFGREELERFLKEGRREELCGYVERQIDGFRSSQPNAFIAAFVYFSVVAEVNRFSSGLAAAESCEDGFPGGEVPDFSEWAGDLSLLADNLRFIIDRPLVCVMRRRSAGTATLL